MFLSQQFLIEISKSKLTDYLFNLSHPDGWSKAKYFKEHSIQSVNELESLLIQLVQENTVNREIKTPYGLKFIVDGSFPELEISLRTIWIVVEGQNICKFVTAYPI